MTWNGLTCFFFFKSLDLLGKSQHAKSIRKTLLFLKWAKHLTPQSSSRAAHKLKGRCGKMSPHHRKEWSIRGRKRMSTFPTVFILSQILSQMLDFFHHSRSDAANAEVTLSHANIISFNIHCAGSCSIYGREDKMLLTAWTKKQQWWLHDHRY